MSACALCGGRYLYGLTWQHRTACARYEADSATAAADHERRSGIRAMTDTEAALIGDAFEDPPEGWNYGVRFSHSGIHSRRVVYIQGRFSLPATRKEDDHV